ncbi:MAG: GNAT family N-acetyltransferase [Oscillospiraceae bacterium]|jgi:GNAT superfamily N-acetyltransferase|nr:GNAT family N-acetyltransferase [Oscillospiraceae bacterium]
MQENIYVGLAQPEEYDELIALLDHVFFIDKENDRRFLALLPSLYKKQYAPWKNNYIVRVGGAMKAAVGVYMTELTIAGHPVRMGGIGNVAVHKDARRLGYMKLAMDAAMQAMRDQSCDFAELGGMRQRYGYWGFERGGAMLEVEWNKANLRHAYPNGLDVRDWRVSEILPSNEQALRDVQRLIASSPIVSSRNADAFYDYLCNWASKPHGIYCGDRFSGFFMTDREGHGAHTLHIARGADIPSVLQVLADRLPEDKNTFYLDVPLWDTDMLQLAEKIAESMLFGYAGQYAVFDWLKMLTALFDLRAQLGALADGKLAVQIGGEAFQICVRGGRPEITAAQAKPDVVLDSKEAIRFFTAPYYSRRGAIDPALAGWFPLPLYLYGFDKV